MDAYLAEESRVGSDPGVFNESQLITILQDMFLAGTETTSKTLEWACLFMIKFPEVQRRVQDELDSVVGPHRMVVYGDKPSLPYTEACLLVSLPGL